MTIDLSPSAPVETVRRARILAAAERAFTAYGFARTTMDDIAREAGMSRPALYLQFRNKTDLYRAIAQWRFDEAAAVAEAALSAPGALAARLERMIETAILAFVARFHATPHGAELLDLKNRLAADLHAAWRQRLVTALSVAIEGAGSGTRAGGAELTPAMLATLFMAALEGLKEQDVEPATLAEATRQLAALVAGAVR